MMNEELFSFSFNDVDDILSHTEPLESTFPVHSGEYFSDNVLASLDTSVSPVELLSHFSPNSDDFWTDSSANSSPCSTDSDYSHTSPIKCEEQLKPIKDIKPQSSIKKATRKSKPKFTASCQQSTFDGNSSLFFTRDQLLKMSCDELERRVSAVEAVRRLTDKEKKEVKRQRRMIKNRESAYASRVRKKQLVENMEEAMAKIQAENDALKARVQTLEKENQELKAIVSKSDPFWSIGGSFSPTKIATQTSTSLFIILLSFGLLFAQIQPQDTVTAFPQFSSVFPSHDAQKILGSGHVISLTPLAAGKTSSNFGDVPGGRGLLMYNPSNSDNPTASFENMNVEEFPILDTLSPPQAASNTTEVTPMNSHNEIVREAYHCHPDLPQADRLSLS